MTPYKSEMKIKEYNMFRAYYCGLCKTMGSEYNQLTRMGLNYDLSFLSLLLSSLEKDLDKVRIEKCIAHPISKRMVVEENESLKYTSSISIMLIYFKLLDDWKDDRSVKSLLANIPFSRAVKKAQRQEGEKFKIIREKLDDLSKLEEDKCAEIDEVAHDFAKLMEKISSPDFIKDKDTRRILGVLGYNLGRWIYILDAFDDLEEDMRDKTYNALLLQHNYREGDDIEAFIEKVKPSIEFSLTLTLENIAKSFELLEIRHNREILENIIYLGMRSKMDRIFNEKGGENIEQSI